jgi:hypothetical protein
MTNPGRYYQGFHALAAQARSSSRESIGQRDTNSYPSKTRTFFAHLRAAGDGASQKKRQSRVTPNLNRSGFSK